MDGRQGQWTMDGRQEQCTAGAGDAQETGAVDGGRTPAEPGRSVRGGVHRAQRGHTGVRKVGIRCKRAYGGGREAVRRRKEVPWKKSRRKEQRKNEDGGVPSAPEETSPGQLEAGWGRGGRMEKRRRGS